jgi:putative ABC transport system permease protein
MSVAFQDLRHAVRTVARMRGVGVVAIVTIALGIGAATLGFSVVYAALYRALPFEAPDQLVMLSVTRANPRDGLQRVRWSFSEVTALGPRLTSLENVATYTQTNINLTSDGDPEQGTGEIVSPGYFRVLRIAPERGRVFSPEEGTAQGARPVVVISARLWQRRFGSDPAIVGRSMAINQVPLTVIGVLPASFSGLSGKAELWIPTQMAPRLTYAEYLTTPQHFINLVGRLNPGVGVERAAAELASRAPGVVVPERAATVQSETWGATVWPLSRARVDASAERSVLLLLAAVSCLLLIACVNLASLLLTRAFGRRREIAVRLAVGSSRSRLIRQLLTESLVIAAIGGALGVFLALVAIRLVAMPAVLASSRNGFAQVSPFAVPSIDAVVLLFAVAATVGTSVFFGLAPALDASRVDLVTALKDDGRSGPGRSRRRALGRLVTSEVAVAVLLLSGAGLLLRSFVELQTLRAGFRPEGVLSFRVNPPASQYPPESGPAIIERLLTRVQQVPGVITAAVNRAVPLMGGSRTVVYFPGRDPSRPPVVGRHYVSADYFRTLNIPLLRGRVLADADRLGRAPVTVINEAAARRFWPGQDPVGQHVWFGSATGFTSPEHPVEVVGVVGDVKYGGIDEATLPDFYTSYLQFAYPDTIVLVKTDSQMETLVPSLRSAVASVDAGLPIYDVRTLDESVSLALSRPEFHATTVTAFAISALVLAGIGVYGVMAYAVASRRREIGVRLALGADRHQVMRLVVGEGLRLSAVGAAIGLFGAAIAGRSLRALLFGVAPADPLVMVAVAAVTLAVAAVAAFIPARRAGKVDAVEVLRSE